MNSIKNIKKLIMDEEEILKADPFALQYMSDELRSNIHIVKFATNLNNQAVQFASKSFLQNPTNALILLPINPYCLQYFSDCVKSNINVVVFSITNSPCTILHADSSFLENKEIVIFCLECCKRLYTSWCPFDLYPRLSDEFRNDVDIILSALKYRPSTLFDVDRNHQEYRLIVKEFLKWDRRNIVYLSMEDLDEEQLAFHYISCHVDCKSSFLFFSERLRNHIPLCRFFLKNCKKGLQYVGRNVRQNESFLTFALQHCAENFAFFPVRYKNSVDFQMVAIQKDGFNLFQCKSFTKEMIEKAVKQNPKVYNYLSPTLQNDKTLFLKLVQKDISVSSKFSVPYKDFQNFVQIVYEGMTANTKPFNKICCDDIVRSIKEFLF